MRDHREGKRAAEYVNNTYSERLLYLDAASKYTQSSPRAVRDAANSREITFVRLNRLHSRLTIEELNARLAQRTIKSKEVSA